MQRFKPMQAFQPHNASLLTVYLDTLYPVGGWHIKAEDGLSGSSFSLPPIFIYYKESLI